MPKRIVIFGSSSIYGTADAECGGFVNRFRLWYESVDARHRVYNLGIWGEQTRGLIDRLASEATRRRPHLIMIYPGFNDIRREGSADSPNAVSLSEFREMMTELLTIAQAITETVIVTGYPFDEARTTPYAKTDSYYLLRDAEAYTNALVAVANARRAKVLDFFASQRKDDANQVLATDGLHRNARGHELLFRATQQFFRETYKIEASQSSDATPLDSS